MKARNFLLNFIPKELLYIKYNDLEYDLELAAALGLLCTCMYLHTA
jgi:hypothetical protein